MRKAKRREKREGRTRLAYERMAELTFGVCQKTCRDLRPYRCCEPSYCQLAIDYAKEDKGVTLHPTVHPTLPLMDADNRCTAPAYLRPICSAHQCDIGSLGFFVPRGKLGPKESIDLTRRYFSLRAMTAVRDEGE